MYEKQRLSALYNLRESQSFLSIAHKNFHFYVNRFVSATICYAFYHRVRKCVESPNILEVWKKGGGEREREREGRGRSSRGKAIRCPVCMNPAGIAAVCGVTAFPNRAYIWHLFYFHTRVTLNATRVTLHRKTRRDTQFKREYVREHNIAHIRKHSALLEQPVHCVASCACSVGSSVDYNKSAPVCRVIGNIEGLCVFLYVQPLTRPHNSTVVGFWGCKCESPNGSDIQSAPKLHFMSFSLETRLSSFNFALPWC